MYKEIMVAATFSLAMAALWFTSASDYRDEERAQTRYCDNVATWRAEARQGIAPLDRTGHPDFKEIYNKACN